MNRIFFVLLALTFAASNINAQLSFDKLKKKVQKEAEKRVEKNVDKGIDKAFDKAEAEAAKAVTNDDEEADDSASAKKSSKKATKTNVEKEAVEEETESPQAKPLTVQWNKFDFVPGDIVIFEDDLKCEQNGEFPSKWDLTKGTIENANVDGENVIMFKECNINGGGGIVPLINNSKEDYLPDEFTIEFDAYYEKHGHTYRVLLADSKNQKKLDKEMDFINKYIRFNQNSADGKNISTSFYPGFTSADTKNNPGWRHISISFNKRALKAYIDDGRVLNVPNLGYNPTGITLGFHNTSGKIAGYVKNFRLAKGAVPLYDKFMTDGKIVTTGIKFDVNKSTIKPESMGVINSIVSLLNDKPELKFSVEGHTDSDGEDKSNQTLSEARAKSVMNKLIELGIESSRLKSKGFGESKPVADNNTPEGKANNRRVEFVKF
ncbi:MAG: OmpA family protein [Ignavibacteriales bacterium]|nr:OmpA family protein [Ignavibacteriales bacterium]